MIVPIKNPFAKLPGGIQRFKMIKTLQKSFDERNLPIKFLRKDAYNLYLVEYPSHILYETF